MRWVRSRIRLGSRLALFAFAIQIALSFGHVHLDGLLPRSSTGAAVSASQPAPPAGTHGSLPGGLADFDCPLCAFIQLASTSAPSAPPALPLPATRSSFTLEPSAELALAGSPHLPCQARAPPAA